MSYLLPQLWLCLSIAALLGGLIGWFLRGDNRKKLSQIESRWQKRFSDLEYNNQFLLNQVKNKKAVEKNNNSLVTQLKRMKKAAELSKQQLKSKNILVSNLQDKLDQSNIPFDHAMETSNEEDEHTKQLQKKQAEINQINEDKNHLIDQIDSYKAELIDSQSKLQITSEMLEKFMDEKN